ncbi:MAG: error-prone DNA polymerase [Gemmataceae bacterium]|nr:error-prone DNA polymerase [Gemmataceae bacterium]
MPEIPPPKRVPFPAGVAAKRRSPSATPAAAYAELHCRTNFSFLEGASHPEELVAQAAELGHAALAITDRNSLAGVVRAHVAARDAGLKLLIGAELTPVDAPPLLVWCPDRAAYGRLARLLSLGRRAAPKGECRLTFDDVAAHAQGLIAGVLLHDRLRLSVPFQPRTFVALNGKQPMNPLVDQLRHYRDVFTDRCYAVAELHRGPEDRRLLAEMMQLAREARLPLIAANDVHYHLPERRPLQDVLTAIRHRSTVAELGDRVFPNAERHLKSAAEMLELFAGCPDAVTRTAEIAERCTFSLAELRYEYPEELSPPGVTPFEYLVQLTWEGAKERYGLASVRRTGPGDIAGRDASNAGKDAAHAGPAAAPVLRTGAKQSDVDCIPDKVRRLIEYELKLIRELRYEAYFLTVWDLVRFARSRGILCQGRGSAANSAVCFCLGVTSVDPDRIDVLFERFVSKERNEAPDIDVDFEHERREEVLQYLYTKYGRDRAGLTAEVITYRGRSAVRDVGKALGLSLDRLDALADNLDHYHDSEQLPQRFAEAGVDPHSTLGRQLITLVEEIVGFPRHLSQHVGGMVMTQGPLCELAVIENAAMPDRTVIEWDKDDLDSLGILKVDCLALGMLTAIRKCFDLIAACGLAFATRDANAKPQAAEKLTLATIPPEDLEVYEMCGRADTIGVFQIESRAQMSMLPRLKPNCFYDLVIEVAIVRPGPIQGDMVHPYLRRRGGKEKVDYPDDRVRAVLEKTLGVPIFQEQAMRLAVVAAGFTPGEADQLRRAMGAWRRRGVIEAFRQKLVEGMRANGYPDEFAERIFHQLRGFGEYGFPESHAASFALLVYVSAWLKCYYPAAFAAALVNSQPMGFYAPAQLIADARKHGVEVRPIDVNSSAWDCTLEATSETATQVPTRATATDQAPTGRGVIAQGEALGAGDDAAELAPKGRSNPDAVAGLPRPVGASISSGPTNPGLHPGLSQAGPLGLQTDTPAASDTPAVRDTDVALRLGFRLIAGLSQTAADQIVAARRAGPFVSFADFTRRTRLASTVLKKLAHADAFRSIGLSRREALWRSLPAQESLPLFEGVEHEHAEPEQEALVHLPPMTDLQEVLADYRTAGLTLRQHPISFVRHALKRLKAVPAAELGRLPNGMILKVAGLVLLRQRPATAKGITFVTLEDETGVVNLIVRQEVWERYRRVAKNAKIMIAHGTLQRQGEIIHVLTTKLENFSARLAVEAKSRDFR